MTTASDILNISRNASDDSEQLRSRWATLRALPAQAMPPRGDQPPA